ncbi:hypothetical protein IQ255_00175 [Pleurocapsales cyanobacterium LEGE 10410]|nr:hypothetical protein [Pleurocapsales cyanobacterium LEGE 10410]
MNRQSQLQRRTEQHLKLWIYLLPVVGVIPAVWTLYRQNNIADNSSKDRERQKISRFSINLLLVWLSCYSLCSLGAANASEITSFRLLYANAIITTGYFITCTFLMTRLGKSQLPTDEMN